MSSGFFDSHSGDCVFVNVSAMKSSSFFGGGFQTSVCLTVASIIWSNVS